jgi:hypothetical protein
MAIVVSRKVAVHLRAFLSAEQLVQTTPKRSNGATTSLFSTTSVTILAIVERT